MRDAKVFQLAGLDTEPIKREELGEGKVAYRNLKLLTSGVWTDAGSQETVWYSPEGIRNLEVTDDNAVNIMHDVDNDVSTIGEIEAGSLEEEGGSLFGDVIIDTSTAAGEYADENMQKSLETNGTKGFGGPSVEIDAEGQKIEFNESKGLPELKAGRLSGLGLVKNPASKPVSFARQTANRGVALADGDNAKGLYLQRDSMNAKAVKNALENNGIDAAELSDDQLSSIAESLLEDDEDKDEEEEEEEMEDGEEEEEMPDEGEKEETESEESDDEEETEMEGEEIQVIQEQIDDLWSAVEEMKEAMMSESELSEELESAKEELADADTVQELSEAKEELDKRLSELEDEPEKPKTLSDGDNGDWDPTYETTHSEPAGW